MSTAQALLSEVVGAAMAQTVDPEVNLTAAGIGSGDLIRLVLLIEDHCDAALSAADVDGLHTLADIDLLVGRLTGGGAQRTEEVTAHVDAATG